MPQFQIRSHPHGGTFQLFRMNAPQGSIFEGNTAQQCLDYLEMYLLRNSYRTKCWLEVLSN